MDKTKLDFLLQRQLEVLGHNGNGFTEFRNIGQDEFVGINPRRTPEGTRNEDILKITCIVVDIDPTLPGYSGTSIAAALATHIAEKEQLSSYVIVSSGRGIHLYIPVSLSVNADIKQYLKYLDIHYGGKTFKIDSIGDLARVIRVWGSINSKNGKRCEIIEDHFNGTNVLDKITYISPQVKVNLSNRESKETILNGNRNQTLTSLAGSMRRRGMSELAIEAALLEENKLKCNPPLPANEVLNIAKSISRYEPTIRPKEQSISMGNYFSLKDTSKNYLDSLLSRKPGYATGFNKLDEMLAGLQKGKMYVLAARTNEGKTSLACQIAYNLIQQNLTVQYYPTELGHEPLFDKLYAQASETPLKTFQHGNFTVEQRQKIHEAAEKLKKLSFVVSEDFALTLSVIKERTKEVNPQVIILDFLQAMKYNEGSPQEITENVRGLKQIAEENHVPIILCSQLSRSAINSELSLSHLKGSGSIEEFADVVMALSTVDKYQYPRIVDLTILKSRYSEVGRIRLNFFSSIGRFEEKE